MFVRMCRLFLLFPLILAWLIGTSAAADTLGVVLLHGKQGMPGSANLISLTESLSKAGILVDRPEMCWSRRRIYDRAYPDCLKDIDLALERLKIQGASVVIVAGQSLGANAAIAYGASRTNVDGIIAMAAAHDPERFGRRPSIARSLRQASALVATGKGNVTASFADVNTGRDFSVRTTPAIYLSFFAREGPAALQINTARLRHPLLWIAGTNDASQNNARRIFETARNSKNRYQTVPADHLRTPDASAGVTLEWLKQFAKQ